MTGPPSLETRLRAMARELGAAAVGITRITDSLVSLDSERLASWLAAGFAGEMGYMKRDPARRGDPRASLPGARTLIALAFDYAYPSDEERVRSMRRLHGAGRVARYARGRDYHRVLPKRLEQLLSFLLKELPGASGKIYVDTGPVLERAWAERAGLGWMGKHSLLIRQKGGSWFLLGVILLDRDLIPDSPAQERCGTCRRCLDICPTGAIVAPYRVDSRRCISYLTIELRSAIPRSLRPLVGDYIFGCDECQEVCPWNRHAAEARLEDYRPRDGVLDTPLVEWLGIDEASFRRRFSGSPIHRAGRDGFLRNVCVALGNRRDAEAVPHLAETLTVDPSALVRAHAAWALGRLPGGSARLALRRAHERERDEEVRVEIEAALNEPITGEVNRSGTASR